MKRQFIAALPFRFKVVNIATKAQKTLGT